MPAGDDMGIVSDDEGIDVEEVKSESGFGTVIVVDNLPKVPDAKFEKLCTVVKKIYGQIGVVRENGLFMPKGADGITKGSPLSSSTTPPRRRGDRADQRIQARQGARVQGFQVDDFSKYDAVPDAYKAPEPKPYVLERTPRATCSTTAAATSSRFASETRRKCTGTTRR